MCVHYPSTFPTNFQYLDQYLDINHYTLNICVTKKSSNSRHAAIHRGGCSISYDIIRTWCHELQIIQLEKLRLRSSFRTAGSHIVIQKQINNT